MTTTVLFSISVFVSNCFILAALMAILTLMFIPLLCAVGIAIFKIPNAGWGAGYSRLAWVFRQEYCGNVTLLLPKIHERLGPCGFVKDPWNHGEFVQDGHPALFSITDPDEHAKRRRILGQLFGRIKFGNIEGLMLHHVEEFVKAVGQKEQPFDIGPTCRALEADIISEFSFRETLHAISGWSKNRDIPIVSKNDQKATFMPLVSFQIADWRLSYYQ
ncbi:uncharacterized protein LY79DRAFT_566482 [Colletotrichum navitas]|uniref:Cytochrome P450 n=1 Tax=Colletotrichum navitas TaxID=681940 RepID=A0AAD8V1C9_9PEZI|nr:uncharacterized protein LY79DRAFT_566482 [Colletotrichum navitas]KAK1574245.1 hypothetical protein LY79DRAFT_566482 [Colletotrichum navitas]